METNKQFTVKDEMGNELTLWIDDDNEIYTTICNDNRYDYSDRFISLCKEDAIALYNELGSLIKKL